MKLASCLLLLGVARGRVAARAALGNATRGAPRGRRVAVLLFGQIFHTHNSFTPRAAAGGFAGTPRTRGWACKAFSSTREHLLEPLRGRGFAVSAFVAAASPGGCDAFVESGPPAEWAVLDARRRLCEWLTGVRASFLDARRGRCHRPRRLRPVAAVGPGRNPLSLAHRHVPPRPRAGDS
mmetsp:Transcript_7571/g.22455  ORF Transcript_7571/g.22455 Transcript_7571/m.22455 type:complete len:180 (-) Transcript_7571:403-942(-)